MKLKLFITDNNRRSFSRASIRPLFIRTVLILILGLFSLSLVGCAKKNKDNYKGLTEVQIYEQSQKNAKKEKWARVVEDLEALEARYPYGQYSDQSQLDLIFAYYKKNEPSMAITTADRFLRMNPRHPKSDYVYYLKAMVCYDQNLTFMYKHLPIDRSARDSTNATESFDTFKSLVERFPNSPYATEARQRMIALRDQLANHELYVVKYYIKRGAYLSAANRANYIVQNYDQTTAIPEALRLMSKSYRKLGMNDMASESDRVLQQHTTLPANISGATPPKTLDLHSHPSQPH